MVRIEKLPYDNISKVADLIYVNQPVLSLFTNTKNEYYFLYLVDVHEDHDEYLFFKVKNDDLYSFFYKTISLREILKYGMNDLTFIIHSDVSPIQNLQEDTINTYLLRQDEIDDEWMPDELGFYSFDIPNSVEQVIKDIHPGEYVELLRNEAIYFKVEPKLQVYDTTVSSLDVVSFLSKLTNSFLSFAIHDFTQKFTNLFTNENSLLSSINQLKALLTPRIADVRYGSFEVGLGVDTLNPIAEGGEDYFKWQKTIVSKYFSDIMMHDFYSISEVDEIVDKYPANVRKNIFSPLFQIAESTNYSVSFSFKKREYNDTLLPIDKATRRKITMTDGENVEEIEEDKFELMTFVVAVPEGSTLADINKKSMRKNLLSVSKSDTEERPYQDSFSLKGRTFNAKAPLTLRIAVRGQIFILLCDVFSIEVNSNDNVELYKEFQNEIYKYYLEKVANNYSTPEAKTFYLYYQVSDVI